MSLASIPELMGRESARANNIGAAAGPNYAHTQATAWRLAAFRSGAEKWGAFSR